MTTPKKTVQGGAKEQDAKQEATEAPGKDDVHEQRESGQLKEGLIDAEKQR